jgi:hypothetical protein
MFSERFLAQNESKIRDRLNVKWAKTTIHTKKAIKNNIFFYYMGWCMQIKTLFTLSSFGIILLNQI